MSSPQSRDATYSSEFNQLGPATIGIGSAVVKVVSINIKVLCNRNNPSISYQVLSIRVMLVLNDEVFRNKILMAI